MTDTNQITKLYDFGVEQEYIRLIKDPVNEAEFLLTKDLIDLHFNKGSKVIDIGGGPGRYTEYLLKELNCIVALVDLSSKELEHFKNRIEDKFKERIEFIKQDSATDLEWIEDNSFDNILLMGPLYHLVEKEERVKVLQNCKRILKPNGKIIITFISPYANLKNTLDNDGQNILNNNTDIVLDKGEYILIKEGYKAEQYRCFPFQAKEEIEQMGFKVISCRNLQGIGSFISNSEIELLNSNSNLKSKWFELLRKTCEIPDIIGATRHYSFVVTI